MYKTPQTPGFEVSHHMTLSKQASAISVAFSLSHFLQYPCRRVTNVICFCFYLSRCFFFASPWRIFLLPLLIPLPYSLAPPHPPQVPTRICPCGPRLINYRLFTFYGLAWWLTSGCRYPLIESSSHLIMCRVSNRRARVFASFRFFN